MIPYTNVSCAFKMCVDLNRKKVKIKRKRGAL